MLLYCEKVLVFHPTMSDNVLFILIDLEEGFRNINDSVGSILREIESTEKIIKPFYNTVIFEYNPFF